MIRLFRQLAACLIITLFLMPVARAEIRIPSFNQNLDLSSVERLYKSARYRVDVKRAGAPDSAYQQDFVFETRNDWVMRDYFNKNPERRGDVLRSADAVGAGKSDLKTASFTNFSFANEAVDVRVTVLDPQLSIDQVKVRPLRFGLPAKIAGDRRSLVVTLDRPRKISVEINGRLDPLFLFDDAPDTPDTTATYYFGPGLHRIPGDGTLVLKSNERVYIAAGAIVEGRLRLARGSSNISIRGRGLLSGGEWWDLRTDPAWQAKHAAIYTEGADHALIEGLTLVQSTTWQVAIEDFSPKGDTTHDNVYRDLNMVSWNGCTDGIWITGNRNRVDDVFIFANDDAFVTKGGRGTRISNAVVWGGTWGRFFLFFNTFPNTPPVRDLVIENVDVIGKEGATTMILFQNWGPKGHLPIKPTATVTFRNIVFEERRRLGNSNNSPANGADLLDVDTSKVPGAISGLTFENVALDQLLPSEGVMAGSNSSPIDRVRFIGITVDGKPLTSLAALNLHINEHVHDVRFEGPVTVRSKHAAERAMTAFNFTLAGAGRP